MTNERGGGRDDLKIIVDMVDYETDKMRW